MTRTFHTPAQPEGITHGAKGDFYVGGLRDGSIHHGDLATGEVTTWQEPGADGRASILGLALHRDRHLVACGGRSAEVYIFGLTSGALESRHAAPAQGSFFNDVWVVGDTAYFTDSHLPFIWRLDLGGGELGVFAEVPQAGPALYLNGITATADETVLLVAAQGTGQLWRADLASGKVTEVGLPTGYEFAADGLLLAGKSTLIGVCNEGETLDDAVFFLAALQLNGDATSAVPIGRFEVPDIDSPTTIALAADGQLLVVSSQLKQKQPVPPFRIVAMELPQILANQAL